MQSARFLSIMFAVLVVVAAGTGVDYLWQIDRPDSSKVGLPELSSGGNKELAVSPYQRMDIPPIPQSLPRGGIHKCTVNGDIVYSDQPCAPGTGHPLILKGDTAGLAPDRSYQSQLAELEAEKRIRLAQLAREEQRASVTVSSGPSKADECKWIDLQVASIDARMRQPYTASEGDYWRQKRKDLMDRRFSIGC